MEINNYNYSHIMGQWLHTVIKVTETTSYCLQVSSHKVVNGDYIMLSPAKGLHLSDFRYAARFGLAAMRSLNAFRAGI